MRTIDVSNSADIIDSRDIIARIEELENDRDYLKDKAEEEDTATEADKIAWAEWQTSEEAEELKVLLALQEEAEGSPDWKYGEGLIRDSYFTEYAQQLAEDTCDMKSASAWPFRCIDWEQAADELKADYFSVDYDGVTYWIRG